MTITFEKNIIPEIEKIIDVYKNAGLLRPVENIKRMEEVYNHSNLVITA
jgi:hypothetical protein